MVILAVLWALYLGGLHPWLMNWGATLEEQQRALPGDELMPDPSLRFTRAITIHAPPSEVWRWIVQMGQERAGFYSYTWLENLTGADIHNTDAIKPEWQHRALGDYIRLARPDLFRGRVAEVARTRIVALEQDRLIANIPGRFVLQPVDGGGTRLLTREPVPGDFAGRIVNALAWDPVHFVMQQRMLRGIKERAEGRPLAPAPVRVAARTGWVIAVVGLIAGFSTRGRRGLWILLPTLVVLPVVGTTGDWDATLAGFLAIGIAILGALVFGRRWWPPYLLLAGAVGYTLLLSPDAYSVFGLVLGAAGAVSCVASPLTKFSHFHATLVPGR